MITKLISKTLVIAEVAQAHEGSLGMAHAYIDAIADAGADAVKFQTHYASEESSPEEPWRVKFSTQDKTRYDYWKRMEFTPDQWIELANHAHQRKLLFISSPFSLYAVEVLLNAGIDVWKIASGEITNRLMLQAIAATQKPVMLSTGMSTYEEVAKAAKIFLDQRNDLLIFQCTSNYPVAPEKVGLNVLKELEELFDIPTGLSDHSGNIYASLAAVALGAKAVEVHVTFSKSMFGPDINSSITFEELKNLTLGVKHISTIINNPVDKNAVSREFLMMRNTFMKSFVAKRFIPKGKIIEIDDLGLKKPCIGIPASNPELLIGKRASVSIEPNKFIMNEFLDND